MNNLKNNTRMKHFILLLSAILPCIAFAQKGKVDTLRTYHIEEVTVTAKRSNAIREIIPVQTLSGIDLQKLSTHSVADAIRYFAGAQIKDYGGIGGLKTVNIRSMGTNHVGVFYDGIAIGNAQNGTVDLGKFSLDNMESVTIYNGQKSSVFQSAKDFGVSSAIYLQSKTPVFFDQKNNNISATFKTGSFGLVNPSISWEHRLTNKVSSSVSAEYLYTTGKYKFRYKKQNGYDTTAVRKNGDVNALRAEAGLYGRIENGYWRTKAYVYRSERGYPAAIVRGMFSNTDRQWDTNFFLQGTYKKTIGKIYNLLVNAKYSYDYAHFLTDASKDTTQMYMESLYRQNEMYLSAANQFNIKSWWDISLSADFLVNTLTSAQTDFTDPRRYSTLVALATAIHFDQFKLQGSILGNFIQDKTNSVSSGATADQTKFTPAVMASYRPWKETGFNIRAFYKEMFRMPTFNDLYYSIVGISKLKPEYTTQYDIGFTYETTWDKNWLHKMEVQLDGYYNAVKNKIVAIPTNSFIKWSMINLGEVEIKGIDANIRTYWKFGKDWSLNGTISYTYQKAQDFTPPQNSMQEAFYGGQIPYIPWHNGSFILNGSYREWELNYSFIYTGERYSSQANTIANYVRPWYTSDLSLARNFRWSKMQWRATVEVNNLFNQQYEVVDNYPMPGTNFKIILNVKL